MSKKILLGFLLSPLLLLASPQNLANISDLKESIAILINRLNILEKEINDLKQKNPDVSKQQIEFDEKNQELNMPNNKESEDKTDNKEPEDISYLSQNKIQDSKKEPSASNKDDSDKKAEMSDSKIPEPQEDTITSRFNALSYYINQKLSDFEHKIKAQLQTQKTASKEISQSNQCDDCISKTDFSNYKFERLQKEKNLQRQIDILRKQLETLNIEIREIKNYYEGS